MKLKVLFLCATNSVPGPMAEALLNQVDPKRFEVTSAGIDRGENHPLTVEVMKEIGLDLAGRSAKTAQDVLNLGFDFVITLCDRSRSECPSFPKAELVHWQFDDPLAVSDPAKQKQQFRSLRDQIAQRIRLFALVQVRFVSAATSVPADPRLQRDVIHS